MSSTDSAVFTTAGMYERLAVGVEPDGDGPDAGIRIVEEYEPLGGPDSKIYPAIYPGTSSNDPARYLLEDRYLDGEKVSGVVISSRQAMANHVEEALQAAIDSGAFFLPHLELDLTTHGTAVRITSLTAPHRSRDAYFRDSLAADGTPFDKTEVGKALRMVSAQDATAMLLHSPVDLVLGAWDSQRSLRLATRFPRIYTCEVVGLGVEVGRRAAGRSDLLVSGAALGVPGADNTWTLAEKGTKGVKKLSELGHGSIPPSVVETGGVSCRRIIRTANVGFAGVARLRFDGMDAKAARAARTLIACLGLAGDRLAFARPGLFLRSGCELARTSCRIEWVGEAPGTFTLDRADARALLTHALSELSAAGVALPADPVRLRPGPDLQKAIDKAYYSNPAGEQ